MSDRAMTLSAGLLMSLNQAAEYLGLKPDQVRWLHRTRKIRSGKILGKVYFLRVDIDKYLEEQFIKK